MLAKVEEETPERAASSGSRATARNAQGPGPLRRPIGPCKEKLETSAAAVAAR